MKDKVLLRRSILDGYDVVSTLYPHVPPLSHWRAWEYAAYRNYRIDGRILDLGCGDGRYFRMIWPHAVDVVGVDVDPKVAELGGQSGVYSSIHTAPAHRIPEPDSSFDHVFANCSLEHMDHLDAVLSEICRCLTPGGTLLCSVVTNHFVDWSLLPQFVEMAGFGGAARKLRGEFLNWHHLANPLSVEGWVESFTKAGLIAEEHVPILPKHNGGAFLMMDSLWHLQRSSGGEAGDVIFPFLSANPNFPGAFRKILDGLLDMETDWLDCCGAIFLVRKPK